MSLQWEDVRAEPSPAACQLSPQADSWLARTGGRGALLSLRCDGQIGEEAEPEAEHTLSPVFCSLGTDYAELSDPVQ